MSVAAEAFQSPLVTYTIFPDVFPKTKTERADVAWEELVERVKNSPTYIDKKHCPLISIAEYGDERSDKDCLRHGGNIKRVFGCEIDYDGEQMPIEEAASKFQDAGICALLYTSPSHKPDKPRWRALLPFSEPYHSEKRMEYTGRANRILGGVATRESFTLSQSFYIGRVTGAEYIVIDIPGQTIDFAAHLEPLFWVDKHNDGDRPYSSRTDAELRGCFASGNGRYEAMLSLSSRWAARGMSREDIEANLYALLESGGSTLNKDGVDLTTRVAPMARSAVAKYGESRAPRRHDAPPLDNYEPISDPDQVPPEQEPTAPAPAPMRNPMRWLDLSTRKPPVRTWRISHWLTSGPTLLAGRGGIGKTLIAQTIATALALGKRFLDDVHSAETVLFWACEDDHDELWRRQVCINKYFEVDMEDLEGRLIIEPRIGLDNTLFTTSYGAPSWTSLRDELRAQVGDYKSGVVFLDNIGQTFGGKENDRHHVTTFCNGLSGIGDGSTSIVLMGHPAKASDSEFSGSTAWENAVRMRWLMGATLPEQEETDEPEDPNVRYLCKRKTNYTVKDWLKLKYSDGVFSPEQQHDNHFKDRYGSKNRNEDAERCILFALERFKESGMRTTDGRTSPDYLPKKMFEAKLASDYSKKELGEALMRLRMSGKVGEGVIGKYENRTVKRGLVAL